MVPGRGAKAQEAIAEAQDRCDDASGLPAAVSARARVRCATAGRSAGSSGSGPGGGSEYDRTARESADRESERVTTPGRRRGDLRAALRRAAGGVRPCRDSRDRRRAGRASRASGPRSPPAPPAFLVRGRGRSDGRADGWPEDGGPLCACPSDAPGGARPRTPRACDRGGRGVRDRARRRGGAQPRVGRRARARSRRRGRTAPIRSAGAGGGGRGAGGAGGSSATGGAPTAGRAQASRGTRRGEQRTGGTGAGEAEKDRNALCGRPGVWAAGNGRPTERPRRWR